MRVNPRSSPRFPANTAIGDTRHTVSDISAIERLGWQPSVPIEQNVVEYLEWMSGFTGTADYLAEAEKVMREQQVIRSVARS